MREQQPPSTTARTILPASTRRTKSTSSCFSSSCWTRPTQILLVAVAAIAMLIVNTGETRAFAPRANSRRQQQQPSSSSTNNNKLMVPFFPSSFLPRPAGSATATALLMTEESASEPTTFREAEVIGLKYMQDGSYDDALKAFQKSLKLPGSRTDIVRTKLLSGPSPVGGSSGGTESRYVESLDEFELQAAHYNMACAHAQLGNLAESIQALQVAFENGFDNFPTVRSDPDLAPIREEKDFVKLMEAYEPKKGFNPFGMFGGN